MDTTIQKHLDAMVEDEISKGFRIIAVPPTIQRLLEFTHEENERIPIWRKIRLQRLTPRGKRLLGEEVVNRFNDDAKSGKYLFHDELRKLLLDRGAWTAEDEERIKKLQEETSGEMQALYLEGFEKRAEWLTDLAKHTEIYLKAVDESDKPDEVKTRASKVFDRWLNWAPEREAEYTEQYAAEQGREKYSADSDFLWLVELASNDEVADALTEVDVLRRKLQRLMEVRQKRLDLNSLLEKRAKLFSECVESRRDKTSELAQIYYGAKLLDDADRPAGNLTPSFDDMWDLHDGVIEWLLIEAYCFYEGITQPMREYLEAWGFFPKAAEPETGSPPASDESPAPSSGKTDSPPSTETPASSLMLTPDKILT